MTSDESSRVERIYASAKRGAMREALAELKAMDLSEASEPFRDLANRYKERFDTPNAKAGSQSLLEQIRFTQSRGSARSPLVWHKSKLKTQLHPNLAH